MKPLCEYCFICPTYGQYDYARAALASFFLHTPNGVAVVADDAHPDFHPFWNKRWRVVARPYKTRGGVTRSWNYGLSYARKIGAKYTICGNDDILFTPDWWKGPAELLAEPSLGIVGPLSNGPGLSNKLQNIWDHVRGYQTSDSPSALATVATRLRRQYPLEEHRLVPVVNGFFMIARTERWWEGAFDRRHVFNPHPSYAMVHSEHELQLRFLKLGWPNAVSLTSFIFHYRSVSRGDKFKHGLWYRRPKAGKKSKGSG